MLFHALVLILIALTSGSEFAAHFDEGNRLVAEDDMKSALLSFKKAHQLKPSSDEALNNIGVCYLRLERYKSAKRSFESVLKSSPQNEDAKANLEELKSYAPNLFLVNPEEKSSFKITNTKISNKKLTRVHIDDLYLPRNVAFRMGDLPFVLTGVVDRWANHTAASEFVWSLEWFERHFPESAVDFYPHNMPIATVHPFIVPMHEAAAEFRHPSGKYATDPSAPGTYLQWNLDWPLWLQLRRDFLQAMPDVMRGDEAWASACLPSVELQSEFARRLHWRMVLIGTDGAGMFNHADVLRTSSWQAQLTGAKLWHICSPSQSPYLYSAGDVDTFRPDFARFPLFSQAECYLDTLNSGEVLYYPADYWHQTRNLATPSVSLTSTMVDQNNWRLVAAELESSCLRNKFRWDLSPALCTALLHTCVPLWERMFEVEGRTVADVLPDRINQPF